MFYFDHGVIGKMINEVEGGEGMFLVMSLMLHFASILHCEMLGGGAVIIMLLADADDSCVLKLATSYLVASSCCNN